MNTVNASNYKDFEKAYKENIAAVDSKWNKKIRIYNKVKSTTKRAGLSLELDLIRDEHEDLISNSYKKENNHRVFWYSN